MMNKNMYLPWWILTVAVVLAFTLPVLVQDAMFQDAMLYSCVSHNLSLGIGTFWFPQYSKLNIAGIPSFHEQPPLVFGIQSIFYRILGDSIYVERFYTFLTLVLHIILINKLWKLNFSKLQEERKLGWIAVFFWILIPVCWWCFHNNLMENTMSLFDLSAVILIVYSLKNDSEKYLYWIGAGLMIFLASFSKGVPGFFPVAVPFLYWLVYKGKGFKKIILYTGILILIPAIIYFIFFQIPVSRESLSIYVFQRLLGRVNSMPTADYRLQIIWRLFTELIPVILCVVIVSAIAYYKNAKTELSKNSKNILFYFLVGLSGSIPLTLTMVQKGWYLVPAFPYLAISAALIVSPFIYKSLLSINLAGIKYKVFRTVTVLFLVVVLIVSARKVGHISREKETLSDVYKIGKIVPRFSTVTVPENQYDEYNFVLQGFLVRNFNISIDPGYNYKYFLIEKGTNDSVPQEYKKLDLNLEKYELYVHED